MRALILALVTATLVQAAEPPHPAPAAASLAPTAELRPLMLARGESLFSDSFDEGWEKRWGKGSGGWQAGTWTLGDGGVRSAPVAAENHHPALQHRIALTDAVVQFAFRFDDADSVMVGLDDKEHIVRLVIRRDSLQVVRMSGTGPTTKSESIDRAPVKLEPGHWYTAVIEIAGSEILAHIDEKWIVYGEAPGIELAKGRVELMCSGGAMQATFDEVHVWKADGYAKEWEKQRKPKLLEMMKKRKP